MSEKIIELSNNTVAQEDEKLKEEGLLRELSERRHALYEADDNFIFHEQIFAFAKKLQESFNNYKEYKLYHLLIGSSIVEESKVQEFDFPGEFSIERFLRMSDEERTKFIQGLKKETK